MSTNVRRRTIRWIGYPVAAYFGGLAAWSRALAAGYADVVFVASMLGVGMAGVFVFVTEAIAWNIEEAPRG